MLVLLVESKSKKILKSLVELLAVNAVPPPGRLIARLDVIVGDVLPTKLPVPVMPLNPTPI